MDPEIDELKELVARQGRVIEETNRMVHSMRRSQRWQTLLRVLWWATILGISGWAYFTFVQPYVDQILAAYGEAKDFQLQIQNFFAQFGHMQR